MEETVSIIVPVYNVEEYIDKAIESLVNQTYKNLEIILVDDGSTDRSLDKCYEWEKKDRRINVLHQKNYGAFKARKLGLRMATGKYVGFVDGDDWVELNMFQELVSIMESTNVMVVESAIMEYNGSVIKKRKQKIMAGLYEGDKYEKEIIPKLLYSGEFFEYGVLPCLVSKLFKRDEFVKEYFSIENGGDMGNDAVIVYPYLIKNKSIFITDKRYYYYRKVYNNSITGKKYDDIYNRLNVHINIIEKAILNSKYINILIPQLLFYKMRTYTLFCPWIFDDSQNHLLRIFGGIKKNEKVVIYGAGKCGIRVYPYVKKYIDNNLVAWVDKNYKYIEKERNLPVISPSEVDYSKVDKVIITVVNVNPAESIERDLKYMGIDKNKIYKIDSKYIENPQEALNLIKPII